MMPLVVVAANPTAALDQWTNTDNVWQNGNLNSSQADYREDDVVPYRARLSNLTVGHSYSMWIEWDTTKAGKHAVDFLKTYNFTEAANPCAGATCTGSPTFFPIPIDDNINNATGSHPTLDYLPTDPNYQFTMWGGSITAAGTPVITNGTYAGGVYLNDTSTGILITFTTTASDVVLAWGGHISTHSDWGVGETAVNIPGSPYHMRLGSNLSNQLVNNTDGSKKTLGNQDRSLQVDGFASRITIIKEGDPEDPNTLFPFTLAQPPAGKCEENFSLAADGSSHQCTRIRHSGSFTITETLAGANNFLWALTDIACTSIGNPPVTTFTESALPANAPTPGSVSFSINVDLQQDVTCVFTNQHKPLLTLDKIVNNNFGGTAQANEFEFFVTGTNVMNASNGDAVLPDTILKDGDSVVMDGGSAYNVTEGPFYGYVVSSALNCSGSMTFNETGVCTYTNNDVQPQLTVIKNVINNNGGAAAPGDFTMLVDAVSPSATSFAGSSGGTTITLNQGLFGVTETGPVADYNATLSGCAGVIHVGDHLTCTITNDDKGPKLNIIKNTIGGDASFPIVMTWPEGNANPTITTVDGSGSTGYVETSTGTVTVEEILTGQPAPGWDFTSVSCQEDTDPPSPIAVAQGTLIELSGLQLDHNYSCTFTNTRRGQLTVNKVTYPEGSLQPFDIQISGSGTVIGSTVGSISTAAPFTFEVTAGVYSVSEADLAGWDETGNTCSNVEILPGQLASCTIENTQRGHLVVVKNTDPASDDSTQFTVTASGSVNTTAPPITGSAVRVLIGNGGSTDYEVAGGGTYSVVESPLAGWDKTGEFNCTNVNVAPGTTEYCYFTNTQRGHLVVHKITDPANDSTTQFSVTASGSAPSGAPPITGSASRILVGNGGSTDYEVAGNGTYSVEEALLAGWDMTNTTCLDVNVPAGATVDCYITNTKRGHLIVNKVTDPSSDTTTVFSLTASGSVGTGAPLFTQDPNQPITGGSSFDWEVAGNGTYDVDEAPLAGWDMTGNTCADILVPAGEVRYCTITNVQRGHVIVHKITDPASDTTTQFSITASGTAPYTPPVPLVTGDATRSITGGAEVDYEVAGNSTMSVSEAALDGWDMTGNNCNSLFVAAGQTVHCTISNTQRGHVIVHKITDPASDTTTQFSITASGTAPYTPPVPLVTGDATRSITGGAEVDYEVAGNSTMSVSEAALDGWDMTGNNCNSLFVAAGQTVHCTITNTQRGHLIVHKVTDPSSDTTTEFSITADGTLNTNAPLITGDPTQSITGGSSVDYEVAGNSTMSVTEAALQGWDMTGNDCNALFVGAGQTVDCYITNTQRGHLIVHKITDPSSDTSTVFSITAGGSSSTSAPLITGAATQSISGGATVDYEVAGNSTLSVTEEALAGWDMTSNLCDGLFVGAGQTVHCTITNTQRGQLIVTKHTDPSSDTTTEFPVTASGSTTINAPLITGDASRVLVGNLGSTTYEVAGYSTMSVVETVPEGWVQTDAVNCTDVFVAPGATVNCDIYNSAYGHVVVTKIVVNDNGGTSVSSDFTMLVSGNSPTLTSFPGSEQGTQVDLLAGEYSIGESGPFGYAASYSEGCSGAVAAGEWKYCTVTNDDIAPKLTVTKLVINDNGGSALPSDFTMLVNGTDVSLASFPGDAAGVTVEMDAGAFSVSESGPFGYQPNYSADCSGTINVGEVKSCVVTNDDIAPRLIVTKLVVNNDGRTAVEGDFTMQVSNNNVLVSSFAGSSAGVEVLLNAGTYSVTESGPLGYAGSFGVGCSGSLSIGQTASCVVINDDIPGALASSSELCRFDMDLATPEREFLLNFQKRGPTYTLVSSNPGQFYFNVVTTGEGDITVDIPEEFVLTGAEPIHIYEADTWQFTQDDCFRDRNDDQKKPSGGIIPSPIFNDDGTITIQNVPAGAYVNFHLDYKYKGTSGYTRVPPTSLDATGTPSILNNTGYTFSVTGSVNEFEYDDVTIYNKNVFNQ
jgi:hypothetical protein